MYSEAKTSLMQSVTISINSVKLNVSKSNYNNVTRRCRQFSHYVSLRFVCADVKSGRFRTLMAKFVCIYKSLVTSTTGIVQILCCVCATLAHTKHARNFRNTLYYFDFSLEQWLFSGLKIRVSLVRFRDWPPNTQKPPSGGFCFLS